MVPARTPKNYRGNATLSGVSCVASDVCTAVGSYETTARDTFTLAETWDGAAWHVEKPPSPNADSELTAVSPLRQ